jgi:hypothetical protein
MQSMLDRLVQLQTQICAGGLAGDGVVIPNLPSHANSKIGFSIWTSDGMSRSTNGLLQVRIGLMDLLICYCARRGDGLHFHLSCIIVRQGLVTLRQVQTLDPLM